jgi:hypothetical protein
MGRSCSRRLRRKILMLGLPSPITSRGGLNSNYHANSAVAKTGTAWAPSIPQSTRYNTARKNGPCTAVLFGLPRRSFRVHRALTVCSTFSLSQSQSGRIDKVCKTRSMKSTYKRPMKGGALRRAKTVRHKFPSSADNFALSLHAGGRCDMFTL